MNTGRSLHICLCTRGDICWMDVCAGNHSNTRLALYLVLGCLHSEDTYLNVWF